MFEQLSLFNSTSTPPAQVIEIQDGLLWYFPLAIPTAQADIYYQELSENTAWRQDSIRLYGNQIPLPRLTAWYGDPGRDYIYSGIAMEALPWTPLLQSLKILAEDLAQAPFNSVLLNLYRHGQDGVSWHSDDEPELKPNHPIASISLGETRRFILRHKQNATIPRVELSLLSGSILIMRETTQQYWLHQVPKTKKIMQPRINLTFRFIQ